MQCVSSGCQDKATFHLSWIENRRCAKEEHLCEKHARAKLTPVGYHGPSSAFSGIRKAVDDARQFEIGLIVISETNDQQVIYLYEVDGSRRFPILTGIFETTSLDRTLKGYPSPRRLTHDALAASIRLLGGEVQDVIIDRFENDYYSSIARIRQQGSLLSLDIRPSDGFVLAAKCDCPIFVADRVLAKLAQQGGIT
jgi:uncharacterized protein